MGCTSPEGLLSAQRILGYDNFAEVRQRLLAVWVMEVSTLHPRILGYRTREGYGVVSLNPFSVAAANLEAAAYTTPVTSATSASTLKRRVPCLLPQTHASARRDLSPDP